MTVCALVRHSTILVRVFVVFLFVFFGFCFAGVGAVKATTTIELPAAIYEPQTWTASESPYVISGEGFFDVQSDLVIEPGVTVHFSPSSSIYIRGGGSLTAVGTTNTPIIFTGSGDGCGAEERWGGLYVDAQYTVSHVSYAEFHCGSVFTGDLGHYEIDWSHPVDFETMLVVWVPNIVSTEAFIDVVSGELTIDHASFSDLSGAAIRNVSEYTINAENNWWGHSSGPTVESNPMGTGYAISGDVLYDPWIGQGDVQVPTTTTSTVRNPVIFIPGIMGTEFVKPLIDGFLNDLVWLDLDESIASYHDEFLFDLRLNSSGNPMFSNVVLSDVIRTKGAGGRFFNYTGKLIESFEGSGYTLGKDFFLFPYDWRISNKHTARLLSNRIQEILAGSDADKVDIIAHSMGGLVVKEYIRQNTDSSQINKLVFLGTPHLGAPDAIKNLLFGGDLGIKYSGHGFLSRETVKELGLNMESLYELLPTNSFVQNFGSVVGDISQRKNYSYNETLRFLRGNELNSSHIQAAEIFHDSIDNMSIPNDIESYSVQGCGLPTIRRLIKQSPKFGEDEWLIHVGDGDGTVPLGSAGYVNIPNDHKIIIPNLPHSEMPSYASTQPIILDILAGNTTTLSDYSHESECGVTGTLVSVHSPVALSARNDEGQFVGVSTTGDIEFTIPGSRYDQLGENKFIFLPHSDHGESYQVHLQGTATGTFNARVTNIVNNIAEETYLFVDIPVTNQSIGGITITDEAIQAPDILYDKEGDGTFITLQADATTTEEDEDDVTAPTTTLSIQGQRGRGYWYVSTTTLVLSAQDTESGVLRTMYSPDNGTSWSLYSSPISFSEDGHYNIQYYSIDKLGNREEVKITSISIDKTPPEARFLFNAQIQDVSVVGMDAMSSTTVTTTPNTFTVKDEAGNTLQLVFDEINRPILKRASLNRLVYNGRIVVPNARLTSFVWLTNTRNEISSLQQALRYNLDEGLYALYTKIGGRTFVRERANWNTFNDRYESGMKVFNFTTNQGVINYR